MHISGMFWEYFYQGESTTNYTVKPTYNLGMKLIMHLRTYVYSLILISLNLDTKSLWFMPASMLSLLEGRLEWLPCSMNLFWKGKESALGGVTETGGLPEPDCCTSFKPFECIWSCWRRKTKKISYMMGLMKGLGMSMRRFEEILCFLYSNP